jgi:hypothetical protein
LVASLHLARHSAPAAARVVGTMVRHRDAFAETPGLIAGRLCFTTDFHPLAGGWPTPRRLALFCAWESEEALAQFVASSPFVSRFTAPARESWRATLEPVRVVNGEWHGWRPDTAGVRPLARDEPVAVITYGRLRWGYIPTFIWNNRRIVAASMTQPGLIARVAIGDGPRIACTFSIWRSQGDVVRFAYGQGEHKPIVSPSRDTPWADDYFFARFRLLDSSGTWDGTDPVAKALAAAGNGH